MNNTTGRKGNVVHYFICSGYSKSGKVICRPNSVRFSKVDEAMKICWGQVQQSLGQISSLKKSAHLEGMLKANGRAFVDLACRVIVGETGHRLLTKAELEKHPGEGQLYYGMLFSKYDRQWKAARKKSTKRLGELDREINRIGDLLESTPSETLQKRWFPKLQALEQEKAQLESGGVSLLDKLTALVDHSEALERTLEDFNTVRQAELWDTFVEQVVPVMEDLPFGKKTQRTATAFRFEPKATVSDMLGSALEIKFAPKGRGLRPRST